MGGRVVDDNGVGVDGVRITVDGQQRATTDSQGYYKLDQVLILLLLLHWMIVYLCFIYRTDLTLSLHTISYLLVEQIETNLIIIREA